MGESASGDGWCLDCDGLIIYRMSFGRGRIFHWFFKALHAAHASIPVFHFRAICLSLPPHIYDSVHGMARWFLFLSSFFRYYGPWIFPFRVHSHLPVFTSITIH